MNTDIGQAVLALRTAVLAQHPSADLPALERVCEIARQCHEGQRRRSGHPYVVHSLIVATQVAGWGRSLDCIYAALLHDLPDTPWEIATFQPEVGVEVVHLVQELSALHRHPRTFSLPETEDRYGRRFAEDVLTIKIADRLHNTRTWQFVPRARARRIARETIDLIAPLADQLGLVGVGAELRTTATEILARPQGTRSARTTPAPPQLRIPTDPGRLAGIRDTIGDSLTSAAYRRALRVLPVAERDRYAYEWAADLAVLDATRTRLVFAVGLLYSAHSLRRRDRARR